MSSQVAITEVAVVPVFKGFRKLVTNETDGAAKTASQGFSRAFAKTGTDSGKTVGAGFKKAFEQSAQGTSSKVAKALEADVAKTSRALSAARLKEQDAIGKVRLAQAQLNEANGKYSKDSSQVIRAQERLATASRQLGNAHETTERATDDLKRSQGELAQAANRTADDLVNAGGRGVGGFQSSVIGGVASFAGPLIAAFAALGIGNIALDAFNQAKDFFATSVGIASDLNESINAVEVSYGDAADSILKIGENSAKAFGVSQGDLNAYAVQFSSFVSSIAGPGGDVAGTFEQLVGRGSDFASVMNLDVNEALATFQSGLAGEAEPLRKFGIDLSAATVEQYAYANGIAEAGTELTEAQKVQARYGALLQQTDKVAGDFANTQDTLANKNRTNAATWEDIQATIGTGFLPIAEQLAGIVGDDLLPVIAKLAEEQGPGLAKAFADVIPELAEVAEELLPQLPGLLTSFSEALPGLIGLLSAVAPIFIEMAQGGNDQIGIFSALFGLLSGDTSFADLANSLLSLSGPIGDVLRWGTDLMVSFGGWFAQIGTDVANGVNTVVGFVGSIPARAQAALGAVGGLLFSSGQALMRGFLEGIDSMFGAIGDKVSGALEWVMGFFPHSPALRGPLAGSGWPRLEKSGQAFWEQWVGGMGGEGPEFPTFGGGGAPGGLPAHTPYAGNGPAVSVPFTQNNYFDHEDPAVAVEMAGQRFSSIARRARG